MTAELRRFVSGEASSGAESDAESEASYAESEATAAAPSRRAACDEKAYGTFDLAETLVSLQFGGALRGRRADWRPSRASARPCASQSDA